MSKQATSGLEARAAAAAMLEAALSRRGGLEGDIGGLKGMEPRDRGFARALVLATLRRLGPIDRVLAPRLQREPPERVRSLLRLALAQAFYLDTPEFAAVDSAVELAGRTKETRPFKALVNAVLRGALRDGRPADDPAVLAPDWLLARWRAAYGEETALAIAAQIAAEPSTDLSLRDAADAALAEDLGAQVLPGGSLRVAQRGDPAAWPGFSDGRWWVQDAAAAIPARLLAIQPGEMALDMCAAPGGKTLQMAAAGAKVTALDRSRERLGRLSENLARTSLQAEVVQADAASWADDRTYDAVLLDAPCSATGTFRRHPDVLWVAKPADIAALSRTQSALLDAAARRVRPGGRLVYCTCSLEPEEGEAQVRAFLRRHAAFQLKQIAEGEAGSPDACLSPEGWLRFLPHQLEGGQDGFFAARLLHAG